MRLRLFTALLAVSMFAPTLRAADEPAEPTVLIRLQSINDLLVKAKYLAKLSDQEDVANQIIGIVETMDGPKGIEGIDTKRPIGISATVENVGPENPVLVMIPIADEESFINLIGRFTKAPKKDKNGVYPLEIPGVPLPIFVRIDQKYAFITVQSAENVAKAKLPNVAKLLSGIPGEVASFQLRFDRVPEDVRNLIIGQVENQMATVKEQKMPGESDAMRALRLKTIDYTVESMKTLFTEGKELKFSASIDAKKEDLSFAVSVSGREGTNFAKALKTLGDASSDVLGSLPATNAIARVGLNISLPAEVRKVLDPVIDDLIKKTVDDVPDANAAPFVERLLLALAPTLKSGTYDNGAALYGPNEAKKYTLLSVGKVVKGKDIEKTLKSIIGELPAEIQDLFEFDAEKADGVTLHEIKIGDKADANYVKTFGTSSIWLGTSESKFFVAMGPDAKAQIKRVSGVAAKTQPVFSAQFSLAELLPLTQPNDADKIRKVVKKVYGGSSGGNDTIDVTLEGGESATFTVKIKGKLISLVAEAQRAMKDQ